MELEHSAEIAVDYDRSRALSASVLNETVKGLARCTMMVEWGRRGRNTEVRSGGNAEEEGIQKKEEGIQKSEAEGSQKQREVRSRGKSEAEGSQKQREYRRGRNTEEGRENEKREEEGRKERQKIEK